ncbi:polyprenyl synthetase family protein [Ornithinimicrobium ciconiae]|uniref:Polyprenyl synthetase family protein n=1 Tax=Ornithinimicrobium ciconiae TaxID=2594265 RepID=A0A516GA83_9MICO|nr:polyprenyl synthetase family protein [Ornithinimicrobium ciconiae]QDO88415.1 polyprenyl synthetase family protein [Ornithinimicrobium ciconiae]
MPTPHPIDVPRLRERVQEALDADLVHQRQILTELGPQVTRLIDEVAALLSGGKRLRAAFLYWGYRALGGADSPELIRAASSMELFQAAALLHDDVMDDSDLRRGRPTAHRTFAADHQQQSWSGESDRFGHAAAILAGNLCLTWCDSAFATSGLPAGEIAAARDEFDTMRTQLMGGQYLDVLDAAQGWEDLDYTERLARCRTVIRYKSGKYSVEQPLLIGAHAAGAGADTLAGLSAYGLALGEAFQIRDDVLGVYGDPETTGKPAGDDLREGKRTVLIAHALGLGSEQDGNTLLDLLGRPDLSDEQVAVCRDLLERVGAVSATETMIAQAADAARNALSQTPGLTEEGRAALADLVEISTARAT